MGLFYICFCQRHAIATMRSCRCQLLLSIHFLFFHSLPGMLRHSSTLIDCHHFCMFKQLIDRCFDFDIKLSTSSHIVILLLSSRCHRCYCCCCELLVAPSPLHAQLVEAMLPLSMVGADSFIVLPVCSIHLEWSSLSSSNCCRSLPQNQYNWMILNDLVPQLVYNACRFLLYGQNYYFLSFRFICVSRYVLWVLAFCLQ